MTAFELGQALNVLSPRRLHRYSWLFITLDLIIGNVIPLGIGLWQQFHSPTATSVILLIALAFIIFRLLHQLSYRLHISGEDIIIYSGIFAKNVRHVPLANLHNVNLRRNLLHRYLKVAEVRLETAGSGGQSEALLRVLSIEEAEHIQAYLLSQQQNSSNTAATQPLTTSDNLLPLSRGELIRLGLSSGQGLGISAFLLYIFFEFQDHSRLMAWIAQHLFDSAWLAAMLQQWWVLAALFLIAAWLLGKISAIVATFLGYSRFALFDSGGERIQQNRGLLTQHTSHIRKTRIQVWRVQQNPTLRFFKRYRIVIDTAVMNAANGAERGISLLVPLAEYDKLQALLTHWRLPFFSHIQPLAQGAWRRMWIGYLLQSGGFCLALAAAIAAFAENIPPQAALWLWLALLPVQLIAALRRAAFAGWQCEGGYFFYRDGWLWRRWHIIALNNLQILALQHNFFDRRTQMASLILDSMGSNAFNRPFYIRYLPVKTARALAKVLHRRQISP